MKNQIEIYTTKDNETAVEVRFDQETVWLSQDQLTMLFQRDQSVISRHINNVFKEGELEQKSNMQKMHIANSDKPVIFYSLDVILAVGYRTNSKIAIEFRKWATKTLREHIVKGYTLNKKRLSKNYTEFLQAVETVKKLLPAGDEFKAKDVLELVKMFADTWLSLDAYDKGVFEKGKITKRKIILATDDLYSAIAELKTELLRKSEATDIFAAERAVGSVEGIIGNVMQSFGGKEVYPSIEEKAAHLLYFMVKNHPFVDGNKRCGAFSFVWFLKISGALDASRLTPAAITALTILIAESNPREKDKMTGLVMMLLRK